MKIIDLNKSDLIKKTDLNSNWLSTISENLNINCKIYKGDFCLDSLNYFPITSDNYTFSDLFSWKEKNAYQHYYDENLVEIMFYNYLYDFGGLRAESKSSRRRLIVLKTSSVRA